jgi:hypothetical protein
MSSTDLRHANLICQVEGGFFQTYALPIQHKKGID